MKTKDPLTAIGFALFAAIASPAGALEILPRPEPPFGGKIGLITKDSAAISAHAADALPPWNEVPAKQAIDEVKRVLTLHAHN